MSSKTKDIASTAIATAAILECIEAVRMLMLMLMDPDCFVEQKKQLAENQQILMENFTK